MPEKLRPGACAHCGSSSGEVFPCLGCETPYHGTCVSRRGCVAADCALRGLTGNHVIPRDPVFGPLAAVLWAIAALCFVGVCFEREMGDIRTWRPMTIALHAALALACAAMNVGYLRDRRTPAGRLLNREIVGRVLVFTAGLLWVGAGIERGVVFATTGWLAFFLGIVAMACRRNRKTHHPRRGRTALPEMVVNLFIAWFMLAGIAWYSIFGGRSVRNERANTRACYANQKLIAGAMEVYNQDRKTKDEFAPKFFEPLRSGGYLQSVPQDPGQGTGSSGNYRSTRTGNGITCTVHGAIQ